MGPIRGRCFLQPAVAYKGPPIQGRAVEAQPSSEPRGRTTMTIAAALHAAAAIGATAATAGVAMTAATVDDTTTTTGDAIIDGGLATGLLQWGPI